MKFIILVLIELNYFYTYTAILYPLILLKTQLNTHIISLYSKPQFQFSNNPLINIIEFYINSKINKCIKKYQ
jgi:hypothetical protein